MEINVIIFAQSKLFNMIYKLLKKGLKLGNNVNYLPKPLISIYLKNLH